MCTEKNLPEALPSKQWEWERNVFLKGIIKWKVKYQNCSATFMQTFTNNAGV